MLNHAAVMAVAAVRAGRRFGVFRLKQIFVNIKPLQLARRVGTDAADIRVEKHSW